jgi:hypothetical protein
MDLGLHLPEGRTRRIDANVAAFIAAQHHADLVKEAQECSAMLSNVNFDARNYSRQQSIELLRRTIGIAQMVRKKWLEVRIKTDDVVFNLDHFIARCSQDKKRYEAEINGADEVDSDDVGPEFAGEG